MAIALLILTAIVLMAFWYLRQGYLLLSGKNLAALARYKSARSDQIPSLAIHHGWLLAGVGGWLLLIPILILALHIPFYAWTGMLIIASASSVLGQRYIERKHQLEHS
jgi:hypothetical protein